MSDNKVLDLDALVPPDVTIKFGGQEIKINAPKTSNVLRLGLLGQKLQEPESLNGDELDKLIEDLTAQVKKCVPELEGHDLNTSQLLKLVAIISEMAVPPDAKELESRGITPDSPKAP